MPAPDSLVLEHLRAIRADMAWMADFMSTMRAEVAAILLEKGAPRTLQEHDHDSIAAIKVRLDRIERRPELID